MVISMLVCSNLEKKYFKKKAVENVSITVEEGKIYALLGPNGSGKTTLMKMIAGLVTPSSGEISFDGMEIGVETKKRIAYMSTEPFFYAYMKIKDVGKYYQDFFEDFSMEKYNMLLDKMELDNNEKAKDLSTGMAAKLKIAATLSRNARLFMLDEPLNGIDIIAREHIINTILEAANEHCSIIMSSHLVDEMEKIIDNAIFIKKGTVVLDGVAEELRSLRQKSIVEIYKEIYA